MSRGPWLTAAFKAEVWRHWQVGETCSEIGRALYKTSGVIHGVVAERGGVAPVARCRSRWALTLAEREEISRSICAGDTIRQMARRMNRAPSSVSREIARHGGHSGYRALRADVQAWCNTQRPKVCRLAQNPALARTIAAKLRLNWSPQQIARWLEREFGNDESRRVSHETIYRSLFMQARGVLKKELIAHLRRGRSMRHGRGYRSKVGKGCGSIVDAVSIRERPAQAEDRAVPGHWEGDLLCGTPGTQIATLVERRSRFVMLVKLPNKDSNLVASALARHLKKLPKTLRRSLTWDRGLEMAEHKRFSMASDIKVYFCDPRSPWQRGSNENTNGLLRQYFPKGTDLSAYSQAYLDKIALQLNQRPRQTLGFDTPANKLNARVTSTG
jgi:IS30 family transposase